MAQRIIRSSFLVFIFTALATNALAAETISGTVRAAAGGAALAGIDLDVFDDTGASVTITGGVTDAVGNYTLTLPGPGTFTVRADPSEADGYGAQYYNGVALPSQAQPLVVSSGSALVGINFSLPRGYVLSGTVTTNGVAVPNMDLDVFASTGEFLSAYPAQTLADGTYVIGALPAGTYFVRVDPDISLPEQLLVRTYFDGATDLASATPITVGTSDTTGIDFSLIPGGTIQGLVTDLQTGVPLAGLDLDVYNIFGRVSGAQATTLADGTYTIGALPAGEYRLRVDPTVLQGYARTYYPDSPTESGSLPISVTAGARTLNIDFALVEGGTFSGTVRRAGNGILLANIDLDLFDSSRNLMAGYTATTDASGNYQLGPLAPGTYFVRADPSIAQGFAEQYYDREIDIATATPVSVVGGADHGGVNFALVRAGSITGAVFDEAFTPLAGIDLDIFDSTGARLRKGATSGVDGTYDLSSLAPGTYTLRADPTAAQGFARMYFDGRLTGAMADPVAVVANTATTSVNFTLPLGGSISGTVTDVNGNPYPAIPVIMLQVQGDTVIELDQSATTDALGSFTIAALPAGDYLVAAVPDSLLSPPLYYGDTTDETAASVVPLAAGQSAVAIDIAFPFAWTPMVCGDANHNGEVQATDALIALRAGVSAATCAVALCDVDSSGGINASDALRILTRSVNPSFVLTCPSGA